MLESQSYAASLSDWKESTFFQALDLLRVRYPDVMRLLTHLSAFSKSPEERNSATSFLQYFEDFSTMILVVVQSNILGSVDVVSKLFQSKEEDIGKASKLINSLVTKLTLLRERRPDVKDEASALAKAWAYRHSLKRNEQLGLSEWMAN